MDSIVEHMLGRCQWEGSLPALPVLRETIENVGIVGLGHIVAPLPGGYYMTIQIVPEKNAEVANFLHNYPPHTPRPVYRIVKQTCHPHHEELLENDWPHS